MNVAGLGTVTTEFGISIETVLRTISASHSGSGGFTPGPHRVYQDAGIAMRTLRRATKRLGIVSRIGRVIHWSCGQEQFWATLIAL
jgi:hypothetical protein